MIGDFSKGRLALFVLALFGLVYLFLQTRTGPMQISGWSSDRFAAAVGGAGVQQGGIKGQAVALSGRGPLGPDEIPLGNPLQTPNTVLTQGYGVGSHAPAEVWGGVDLAIDGDGDGDADPEGSWDAPVYATHRGVIRLMHDAWPAGNHVWVEAPGIKSGYGHLKSFAVAEGQLVERGQLIGYVGSTGQSSGPHLHYHIWRDNVNVNPLDYGALDGVR